ncbi:J domain-containing protein [Leifsonia sp. Leaf264]|uniref:J domain-containing protein n=1 Tax=Leifsonia sp. Leaf264 TaxID=1736314 RepID=UPI0006FAE93A|nr:J domain-containing protein [Leifsonia sp. Leaf264]KQO98298.1 hypothetical protein ASF30_09570 [Leifsonia sp. Leaf264]
MTHYTVLGVTADASTEDIIRSYKRLVKIYHPDIAGPGGAAMAAKVNHAYDILRDDARRREYDGKLVIAEENERYEQQQREQEREQPRYEQPRYEQPNYQQSPPKQEKPKPAPEPEKPIYPWAVKRAGTIYPDAGPKPSLLAGILPARGIPGLLISIILAVAGVAAAWGLFLLLPADEIGESWHNAAGFAAWSSVFILPMAFVVGTRMSSCLQMFAVLVGAGGVLVYGFIWFTGVFGAWGLGGGAYHLVFAALVVWFLVSMAALSYHTARHRVVGSWEFANALRLGSTGGGYGPYKVVKCRDFGKVDVVEHWSTGDRFRFPGEAKASTDEILVLAEDGQVLLKVAAGTANDWKKTEARAGR